jgi:membrane protein DedA with SNARE-associated domain
MIEALQAYLPQVSATSGALTVFLAIVLGSFVLEDGAAVMAGMAAAEGMISPEFGLFSLFCGIALGDFGLYYLGRFAGTHPWAKRWVSNERVQAVKGWLHGRLFAMVLATRFLPGARLPTYTACGFLRVPFATFALAVIVATLAWTTFLFTIVLRAGSYIMTTLGPWRWPAAIGLAVLIMGIGHLVARRRETRTGPGESPK